MQLMQHTLASLLSFADRARSKLVSSSPLNGVQFAGSRRFQPYLGEREILILNICVERQNSPLFARIMPPRETRRVCSNAW